MRVLQVNKYLYVKGGAEAVMFETARQLEQRDHAVTFYGMRSPRNEASGDPADWVEWIDYRAPMSHWRRARLALASIHSVEAARRLRRLLGRAPQNVAHLHNFHYQLTPSILPPLRDHGAAIVWTLHDYQPICPNHALFNFRTGRICEACRGGHFFAAARERCLKGSVVQGLVGGIEAHKNRLLGVHERLIDRFTAPSRFMQQKVVDFGLPADRVVHLPYPQDLEGFRPAGTKGSYFLYFGRLDGEKGVMTLLRAMREHPRLELRIAGVGAIEDDCRRYVERHDMQNVRFLGFVRDDLRELIAGALCTLVTSEWYENYPMVVLESHASGTAVLGAEIGGIPEMIEAGVDGLLYPSGDAGALATRIGELAARGPDALRHMGLAGRDKVARINDPALYTERLLAIYEQAIASLP
ncbi:MAG: glycosyltransferase [Candidatus Eiseniibacteriota bacterium]|jgi:glycosyltransferase involved in cell wall biosynthesis